MGQSVEVVVSELHSAAARLENAAQRLQDGLSTVDNETTQLLGSGWKGEAASAYGPAWQQWHDGAGQVVQGLQRMSELLTIAGKEYAKTDEQASGALGSSMQGSGGSGGSTTGGHETGQSAGGGMAQQMNLAEQQTPASQMGQVAEPLAQAGQAVAGLPQQAGQAIAGLAQQAVQMAAALAQQAGQAEAGRGDGSAPKDDQRDYAHDERERAPRLEDARDVSEERGDEPQVPGGAAPSGERPAGSAPVSTEPVRRAEATGAVERPSE